MRARKRQQKVPCYLAKKGDLEVISRRFCDDCVLFRCPILSIAGSALNPHEDWRLHYALGGRDDGPGPRPCSHIEGTRA